MLVDVLKGNNMLLLAMTPKFAIYVYDSNICALSLEMSGNTSTAPSLRQDIIRNGWPSVTVSLWLFSVSILFSVIRERRCWMYTIRPRRFSSQGGTLENVRVDAWVLPCIDQRLFEPLPRVLYIRRIVSHLDRKYDFPFFHDTRYLLHPIQQKIFGVCSRGHCGISLPLFVLKWICMLHIPRITRQGKWFMSPAASISKQRTFFSAARAPLTKASFISLSADAIRP